MVIHRDFESDCKRIARYVMKQGSNTQSEQFDDMIDFGRISVDVSKPFVEWFNAEIKGDRKMLKKFNGEINKHLKGCSVKWYSIGEDETITRLYNRLSKYLVFDVEFDDVDPEFEDW